MNNENKVKCSLCLDKGVVRGCCDTIVFCPVCSHSKPIILEEVKEEEKAIEANLKTKNKGKSYDYSSVEEVADTIIRLKKSNKKDG